MNLSNTEAQGLLDVVGGFYDAAADAICWNDAVSRLNGLFDIQGTILEHHDIKTGALLAFEADGLPKEALTQWVEHYHSICPRLKFLQQHPAGTIGFDHLILEPNERKRHPIYQDFLRPYGTGYFLSTTLEHDSERYTTIALQKTLHQGHATEREIELITLLTKPLRRAFLLKKRLGLERSKQESFEAAFHALAVGIMIVDSNGRLKFVNRAADFIAVNGGQTRVRSGYLSFPDARANGMLKHALQRLLLAESFDSHEYCCVTNARGKNLPMRVDILSLPKEAQLSRSLILQGAPEACLLVIMTDIQNRREPPEKLLRILYGLTGRETDLALCLGRGDSLRNFAEQREIALTTARTHLVHLREKLGARNQAQVVKIVSQLVQPLLD